MLSTLKIDGLQLLGGGVTGYAVHDPVEGLESPLFRVVDYDKPGEDGGVVSGSYYGLRPITLNGRVSGNGSASAHETNRQALEAVCSVTRDSTGYPILSLLEFTTLGGSSYYTYVQIKQVRLAVSRGTSSAFQLSMVAPDPRLYYAGNQTTGVFSRASGGGFVLPVIVPITSSGSTGGTATATNTGNILTYPVLTLKGQLTNPYILNGATGQAIQLNRVIAGGETVVIDMAQKTVMLGGSTSLLSTRSSDSVWWGLSPGATLISLSTGSASDTGTLEVTWNNAVMGI